MLSTHPSQSVQDAISVRSSTRLLYSTLNSFIYHLPPFTLFSSVWWWKAGDDAYHDLLIQYPLPDLQDPMYYVEGSPV